jgi:hypothetical protein
MASARCFVEIFPWKENTMDRLIVTANIQYFRERLAAATDDIEVKELWFLLTREEGHLMDIIHRERQTKTRH